MCDLDWKQHNQLQVQAARRRQSNRQKMKSQENKRNFNHIDQGKIDPPNTSNRIEPSHGLVRRCRIECVNCRVPCRDRCQMIRPRRAHLGHLRIVPDPM